MEPTAQVKIVVTTIRGRIYSSSSMDFTEEELEHAHSLFNGIHDLDRISLKTIDGKVHIKGSEIESIHVIVDGGF